MKINTTKLVVGVLAVAGVASLVGSISGTVAWFQYNTRTVAEFTGTTAKCTEFLQVRTVIPGSPTTYGEWKAVLSRSDILQAAGRADDKLTPVTVPGVAKNDAFSASNIFANPVCGYEDYTAWELAKTTDYMSFSLQFRVLDIDGNTVDAGKEGQIATSLWLTDISVAEKEVSNKEDISKAVRVHLTSGTNYALLAPGDASAVTIDTITHGNLDLGGNPGLDVGRDVPNNYSWSTDADKLLDYGKSKVTQVAYNMNKKMASAASNGLYPQDDGKGKLTEGTPLGTTVAHTSGETALADNAYLTVGVNIWLEGWQELPGTGITSSTPVDYIGSEPTAPETNKKWLDTKTNKIFTRGASGWDAGTDIVNDTVYSTDSGKTGIKYDGTKWVSANETIWDDKDYIGSQFNIGMSFGVSTLA